MSREKFSFWLFAFSAALFGYLFYFFLKPFIVAALLVLATFVFARKFEIRLDGSKYRLVSQNKELISASVLTLVFGVLIFVPVGYAIVYVLGDIASYDMGNVSAVHSKLLSLTADNSLLNDYLKTKITEYINTLFSEAFLMEEAKSIFAGVGSFLQGVASSLAELALIVVFFFLLHWFKKDITFFVKSLLPMGDEEKVSMAKEMVSAISVVFLTLVGIMIAQGVAFFALMLFFDYNASLLGFFSALSSVVPIFGTALVWVPIALSEFIKGNILNAIIISAYSWFVMAFLIDNFLRLYLLGQVTKLLNSDYKINEFLLFFSIAAGIAAFGFWGFIIGPSITALFLSSARAYKNMGHK